MVLEMIGLLEGLAEPIALALPMEAIAGIDVRYVVSLLLIALLLFVLGALVETRLGHSVNEWLEERILGRIPGYSLARNLTRGVAGLNDETKFPVGVARIFSDGAGMMGLIMERHADGWVTFFVPQAPTPTLGNIYLVQAERVEQMNVPATSLLNCIMQWGIGAAEITRGAEGRGVRGPDTQTDASAPSRLMGASETTE
jgi:uncharacterized membrane protein